MRVVKAGLRFLSDDGRAKNFLRWLITLSAFCNCQPTLESQTTRRWPGFEQTEKESELKGAKQFSLPVCTAIGFSVLV